jgi:hypothetical protein
LELRQASQEISQLKLSIEKEKEVSGGSAISLVLYQLHSFFVLAILAA